jgi:GNAT superfamily N-acetyltransferase
MTPKAGKKIARNFRDHGLKKLVWKSLTVGLKPILVVRTHYLYTIDLGKIELNQPQSRSDIVFRFVGPDETRVISQIEDMEEWLIDRVAEKLARGQRCLAAMRGDEVAGFNLLAFEDFCLDVIEFSKPLRPGECASEQITVHPGYRRSGLGTDLRNTLFSILKDEGYRRVYGATEALNTANKALTRKVGFRFYAKVRYLKIFRFKQLRVSRFHQ